MKLRNVWCLMTRKYSSTIISHEKGFLGIPQLNNPYGFDYLSRQVVDRCNYYKQKIVNDPPGLQTLYDLDNISNTLCSVIDVAEFCRNVHPDSMYRDKANDCFVQLSNFIQELNTNVDLYEQLCKVANDPDLMNSFTEEQKRMTVLLRAEFERDGIHLSKEKRKRVIEIQNELIQLGTLFQQHIHTCHDFVHVPLHLLRGAPQFILNCGEKYIHPENQLEYVKLPTDMNTMNTVLKWIRNPTIRKDMYIAGTTCAKENLYVLDVLMEKRHELANLLGYDTYADLAICDKLAESPEKIRRFLTKLADRLMPKATDEKEVLLKAKQEYEKGPVANEIYDWDAPYYMGMLKARHYDLDSRVISNYFPLEQCLIGLNILCSKLFQMELIQVPLSAGESWHPDVRKMELRHKDEGLIGYIYLDLYPRPHKYNHAAHFTIQCGRKNEDHSYQIPVVALVTNFVKAEENQPSLLTHSEVETLFHEFGHAMHSLLSRTEFQHLSGTRAQLDFVETPSHLFEYFAWDHRVVSQFAKHYRTGKPIPKEMILNLRKSKFMFGAIDCQTQILYALLDLTLFETYPLQCKPKTSTQVLKEFQNRYTLVPYTEGTFWHTRFGHLVGYGAGYYSYLYARIFASHIWENCFANDPLSPEAGDKFRRELMMHGGAKDPMEMMAILTNSKPSITSLLDELAL